MKDSNQSAGSSPRGIVTKIRSRHAVDPDGNHEQLYTARLLDPVRRTVSILSYNPGHVAGRQVEPATLGGRAQHNRLAGRAQVMPFSPGPSMNEEEQQPTAQQEGTW